MTNITRLETNERMSRVVIHNGTVLIGGLTASDATQDITGQTRQVLEKIESYLAKAGTDNTKMLSAQIWLKDIERDFAGMNAVWDKWLPEGVAPVRATGESKLARGDLLVEIIVTAAV
ncbi:RidA family protein [Alcaligenaceae bacterium]|uniref:RidA family protein n=1 Tax=Pusillimonas sp. MFBS29 TaxID=2886690 RepID=UPI0015D261D5|nr:RidA family protein [Pusillimonas sp. MFBS29]MCC2596235.1 RidA family protein [Pusillimonas sp. MFBS29]NYT58622.1 RidA family protein [Alcaligenaceae bacterium]